MPSTVHAWVAAHMVGMKHRPARAEHTDDLPTRGDVVSEKWSVLAFRLVAEWRKIVAGEVLLVVALIAYSQGLTFIFFVALFVSGYLFTVALYDAACPDDPDTVKRISRWW